MARRTVVELVDDLDGTQIETGEGGTVTFALGGATYEIDLSATHLEQLRTALAPYVAKGRKVGGRTRAARPGRTKTRSSEIRAWAKANGHEVPERGRVPATVAAAYDAAH